MARVFKRTGSQYYYFRVQRAGVTVSESTGETDRKRASLVAAGRIREIEAQGRTDHRAKRQLRLIDLAGDDLAQAKQRGVSEGYYKALVIYWRNLRDFFGPEATLSRVTYEAVRAYEGHRRAKGIRGQSIREEVGCLRRAFAIAKRRHEITATLEEWPEIKSDPPDPKRRGKLISMEVFRRVISHLAPAAAEDLVFDLLTGLRATELARVHADWLDVSDSAIPAIVVPAWASKTRTERRIPLAPIALRIFQRRADLFGAAELFPRHDYRKKIAKACAVEEVEMTITLRDLRTTFATLARRGGDPTAVRDILGHTRYEMTNTYLRSDASGQMTAMTAVATALSPKEEEMGQRRPMDVIAFLKRVEKTETCWLWKGPPKKNGYGTVHLRGKHHGAHRAAWMLMVGEIPEGLHVLHRCDVPLCVNPAHLFLGTPKDNAEDKVSKGRSPKTNPKMRGEGNPSARLTWKIVGELRARRAAGARVVELVREFGLSRGSINKILADQIWKAESSPRTGSVESVQSPAGRKR